MTVKRMQREHGLVVTKDEESNVIKYLSDNQGLTPSEIKPYAYILDKNPGVSEEVKTELLGEMSLELRWIMRKTPNSIGLKFGLLTVLEHAKLNGKRKEAENDQAR